MKKLYIGNLPYQATEADLQSWFGQSGITAVAITMMRDRYTGEARGFGFVELSDPEAELAKPPATTHQPPATNPGFWVLGSGCWQSHQPPLTSHQPLTQGSGC